MITFDEYKKEFEKTSFKYDTYDLETIYKEICINKISNYFDAFLGEKMKNKNNYSIEDMYNWCITLQTLFGIKEYKL